MFYGIDLNKLPSLPKLSLHKPNREKIANLTFAYNIKYKLKTNQLNELSFDLPYEVELNHKFMRNPSIDKLKPRYLIKLEISHNEQYNEEFEEYEEWFMIADKLVDQMDEEKDFKTVNCIPLPNELADKNIINYTYTENDIETPQNATHILTDILTIVYDVTNIKDALWTIGYINPIYDCVYRVFSISDKSVLDFLLSDFINTFEKSILIFDTINRTINLYHSDDVGLDRGLTFSYGRYLKTLNQEINTEKLCTKLKVFGNNDLSIEDVNPTGKGHLLNFDTFMLPYQEKLVGTISNISTVSGISTVTINSHGLSTGDYIINKTLGRNHEARQITKINANDFSMDEIVGQIVTDSIYKVKTNIDVVTEYIASGTYDARYDYDGNGVIDNLDLGIALSKPVVIQHSDYMSDSLCSAMIDYNTTILNYNEIQDVAEENTTANTIEMTAHGLIDGDYIVNRTRGSQWSKVKKIDNDNITIGLHSAESGTNTTNIKITAHGLEDDDYIVNQSRSNARRQVKVVDVDNVSIGIVKAGDLTTATNLYIPNHDLVTGDYITNQTMSTGSYVTYVDDNNVTLQTEIVGQSIGDTILLEKLAITGQVPTDVIAIEKFSITGQVENDVIYKYGNSTFRKLLLQKTELDTQLTVLNNQLVTLRGELINIQDKIEVARNAGTDMSALLVLQTAKQNEISSKLIEIDNKRKEIGSICLSFNITHIPTQTGNIQISIGNDVTAIVNILVTDDTINKVATKIDTKLNEIMQNNLPHKFVSTVDDSTITVYYFTELYNNDLFVDFKDVDSTGVTISTDSFTLENNWEDGTLTDVIVSGNSIVLDSEGESFTETTTLDADFNGNFTNTEAVGDKVVLKGSIGGNGLISLGSGLKSSNRTHPSEEGWSFTVKNNNIYCTGLKVYSSASRDITIRLWSDAGIKLEEITVAGIAGSWITGILSVPRYLLANTKYIISIGTPSYILSDYTTSLPIFNSNLINYNEGRYNSLRENIFPPAYSIYSNNCIFGIPDIVCSVAYPTTGTYIHSSQNISNVSKVQNATITFNKTTPTGTTAIISTRIGTYNGLDTQGKEDITWGSWVTRTSGDTVISAGTDVSTYRLQWKVDFAIDPNIIPDLDVTPSLDDVTISVTGAYKTTGNWISPIYDIGNLIISNVFTFTAPTLPSGTTAEYYIKTSNDYNTLYNQNINDGWGLPISSGTNILPHRYLQVKALLTGTTSLSPTVNKGIFSYTVGNTGTISSKNYGIGNQISKMKNDLSLSSNFTSAQLKELSQFIIEDKWEDTNYGDAIELYDVALEKFALINIPQTVIKISIVNFLECIEEQRYWDKLNLLDTVRIKYDQFKTDVKAKLSEIDFDYEAGTIDITISDLRDLFNDQDKVIRKLYKSIESTNNLQRKKVNWDKVAVEHNASNNLISVTPANPVVANDDTALDHVLNTDSSASISFEWSFNNLNQELDEYNIDGFLLYIKTTDSTEPYFFGSSISREQVIDIPANSRAYILKGVPADEYYTFGIQAYRTVNSTISATGLLKSEIVKSVYSTEDPYRPSANVAFEGDIKGTLTTLTADQLVTDVVWSKSELEDMASDSKLTGAERINIKSKVLEIIGELPVISTYTHSAEDGTTTTNIEIAAHGLVTCDYIINKTRSYTVRQITKVDDNNFTVTAITNQAQNDNIIFVNDFINSLTSGKAYQILQQADYVGVLSTDTAYTDYITNLTILIDYMTGMATTDLIITTLNAWETITAYKAIVISIDADSWNTYWNNCSSKYNLLQQEITEYTSKTDGTFIVGTFESGKRADYVVLSGSTSAQTVINQAINDLPDSGGKIVLLAGTYVIDDSIIIKSNVTLQGQGLNTIITTKDDTITVPVITNDDKVENIFIDNIYFIGNTYSNSGIWIKMIDVKNSNVKLTNLKFDYLNAGLLISYAQNFSINKCGFYNCSEAIRVDNSSGGDTINIQQSIYQNEIDSCGDGIVATLSSNISINNNIINNTTKGIVIRINVYKSLITNNIITNSDNYGIYLYQACNYNSIINNYVEGSGWLTDNIYSNIYINATTGGCSYNNIQGNKCLLGDNANKPRYGIRINSSLCSDNLITNNDCYNSGFTAGISDDGTNTSSGAGNKNNDGSWSTTFG